MSASYPFRSHIRGFTLVEVMMAAVILVVGFIGMIEAVTVTSAMLDHARRQTYANQVINKELDDLRFAPWTTIGSITGISNLTPTTSTAIPIDPVFWPNWSGGATYAANNVVAYNGAWYRCILANSNQAPPNATYWTSVTSGLTTDIVKFNGATYSLARTITSPDPVTNIREITFTVTWIVTASRVDSFGAPLTFTYRRSNSAWYGKYGLNLSYQSQ